MSQEAIVKGSFYFISAQIVFVISGYAIHFGLARLLGPNLYGIYGVVLAIISIVNIILTEGTSKAISKYISAGEDAEIVKRTVFRLQFIFVLIIFCLYQLLVSVFTKLLRDPNLTSYLRVAGFITIPYGLLAVFVGYFNGLRNFKEQTVIHIIYSLSKLFFVFALVFCGFSLMGVFIGFALAPLMGFWKGLAVSGIGKKDSFDWKKMISFAWPLVVFAAVFYFLTSIDLFAVKAILKSDLETGFYNAASTLAKIPFLIFGTVNSFLFPIISNFLSKNNLEMVRYYIKETLRQITLLIMPGVFLIASSSKNLVSFVFSNQYLSASQPLIILIFGFAFLTIFSLLSSVIAGSGKPKIPMIIIIISTIVSLMLNIFLVPLYGLNGAAIATTAACLLGLIISGFLVFKKFNALMDLKSFLKILVGSLIISFLGKIWASEGFLLIAEYIVLFLIYFAALFLFKEIKKTDIEMIKNIILKKV